MGGGRKTKGIAGESKKAQWTQSASSYVVAWCHLSCPKVDGTAKFDMGTTGDSSLLE